MSGPGGLEQARHLFLHGCGLPQAWAGQPHWRILETSFGLGLNFLAAWRAWKDDPARPRILHFVSAGVQAVPAADLVRETALYPDLVGMAQELAAQWFGLTPGTHRLVFEQGRVLLTLFVGDVRDGLRQQPFHADSVFLGGADSKDSGAALDLHALKGIVRHCRRGTALAASRADGDLLRNLAQCGFSVKQAERTLPERLGIEAVFAPAWEPKGQRPRNVVEPGHCVVIGAGLAGASAAASLARRGWQVTVLDGAAEPAAGASGLPVGMIAPHFSPDDSLLSRLTRCGVRATLQQARALLRDGEDWCLTGVLEHRPGADAPAADAQEAWQPWTRDADGVQVSAAKLAPSTHAYWHEQAGWIKPAALVRAWLAQPGIRWRASTAVEQVVRSGEGWQVLGAQGESIASADLVVIAAAHAGARLLPIPLPLQPIRGQVSWAHEAGESLPLFAVNGNGHFIPHVPIAGRAAWFCGSTFDRDDQDLAVREADHQANSQRLHDLLPAAAQELAPTFASTELRAWTGVRCASADRRPLLGEVQPGLWVSTAMGSRGLTFSVLCAELLAAQLHDEPLPLDRKLGQALDVKRAHQ
ncbi:FAD-dependent 5-carboxymethylaminomethyl-2-thiouridine(34) oxidoreductase MnmC [Ramlibacter sp. WS9]|uniref:FAD-dependent 5-carboxymethylaminomethyl-2-thiouridine(34) oxidoreductase MnmC n=1 Tax=Ramlibacter sp. WS9 TaxID=1882741 RepID=UPI001142DC4C|nr:FAD-dependent 5-carboxymethylaminomethyl-2-thiouridine(34) oxidoreductase MnmC [Ramlibacter sp. WS9]ROZ77098.1 FAD-dependent oxidoreductase [Ramlibacter sp. WS9]